MWEMTKNPCSTWLLRLVNLMGLGRGSFGGVLSSEIEVCILVG